MYKIKYVLGATMEGSRLFAEVFVGLLSSFEYSGDSWCFAANFVLSPAPIETNPTGGGGI